jgi:hypothetical protein
LLPIDWPAGPQTVKVYQRSNKPNHPPASLSDNDSFLGRSALTAHTMISEKSSTMFAPANIRLTRSQRRRRLLPISWPAGPQTVYQSGIVQSIGVEVLILSCNRSMSPNKAALVRPVRAISAAAIPHAVPLDHSIG